MAASKVSAKVTSITMKSGQTFTLGVNNAFNLSGAKQVGGVPEAVKKKAAAEAAARAAATQAAAREAAARKGNNARASGGSSGSTANNAAGGRILLEWHNHKFFAAPKQIIGYKGLQITTTTETEDEEADGSKYAKKKNSGGYEVKFTAILDAYVGVTDVRSMALSLAEDGRTGATGYVYSNHSKLFTPNMMGTGATVKNIVVAPNGTWISCEVDMTLKQCSKAGGAVAQTTESATAAARAKAAASAKKAAIAKGQQAAAVKSKTTNVTTTQEAARKDAKDTANNTTKNAKSASQYINAKINSIKPKGGGSTNKITTIGR